MGHITDAGKAHLETIAAERAARRAERPRPTGSAAPDASMIDVGVDVYERKPESADYEPRGGLVCAVTERLDGDTGEIVRSFLTVRWLGRNPHFATLPESAVDMSLLAPPATADVRRAVRRLCAGIGRAKGMWTAADSEQFEAAHELYARVLRGATS